MRKMSRQDMERRFWDLFRRMQGAQIKSLIGSYVREHWDKFSTYPASSRFHHVYEGGLLDHTVEVMEIGLNIIHVCNDVNRTHFIAAAILHDFGKLDVYTKDEDGKWVGTISDQRIEHEFKPVLELRLPRPVQLAILSHMGGWAKTGVSPDIMLSTVLHCADLISSRLPDRRAKQ